jgi:UDP-glucose 4-epimerase
MLKDAETAHGMRHVALRYFNAAGADPDGELGELHRPETHLIPLILFAAMGREQSIKIFGNDYPPPMEPASATTCTSATSPTPMSRLSNGSRRTVRVDSFNLGIGRGFSVAEVVTASEKVTRRPVRTEMCPRRPGDPPVLVSDSGKARAMLGSVPN